LVFNFLKDPLHNIFMPTPPANPISGDKKPKSNKVLIVVIVILSLLLGGMVLFGGLLVAIAIPALATAKADAQAVLAQKVVNGAEVAVMRFEESTGQVPQSWEDLEDSLVVNGKKASSMTEFLIMTRMPEGTTLKIRGINGASQTLIKLPNGQTKYPMFEAEQR